MQGTQAIWGAKAGTLSDRINARWKTNKPGRHTGLYEDEENTLVHYIKYMASIAHPLSVPAIKALAWSIAKKKAIASIQSLVLATLGG